VIAHPHRGAAAGVVAADRRRVPWVILAALAFALALAGVGLPASVPGSAHPGSGVEILHNPIAVVHPSGLPTLTATVHAGRTAAAPLGTAGPVVAFVLLALTFARRTGAGPIPIRATARRLPPRRAPPGLSFTR
jgi:hypothetical protein